MLLADLMLQFVVLPGREGVSWVLLANPAIKVTGAPLEGGFKLSGTGQPDSIQPTLERALLVAILVDRVQA